MPVKLRLQRQGRKRRPFYHIVAADVRAKRDGRYIERIGFYDPNHQPAKVDLDRDKAIKWLHNGAQPTDTVRSILSNTGVMYYKHLLRGVTKGALTQEEADRRLKSWLEQKQNSDKLTMTMVDWGDKAVGNKALTIEEAESLNSPVETAVEAVKEAVETVTEKAEDIAEAVSEKVSETVDAVADAVEDIADAVSSDDDATTEDENKDA